MNRKRTILGFISRIKILLLILAVFIILPALTGCGAADGEPAGQTEWTVTIRNRTGADVTDVSVLCNQTLRLDLEDIESSDSAVFHIEKEELETALTEIRFSCRLPGDQAGSGSFAGYFPNDTVITLSLNETGGLEFTSNISQ